jgi:hypothetical protein
MPEAAKTPTGENIFTGENSMLIAVGTQKTDRWLGDPLIGVLKFRCT